MEPREILFQIWDKEKKRMSKPLPVFHSFIEWSDGDIDMPTDFAIAKNKRFVFRQFTGLKDKKGVEIYEGDIGEIRTQSGRIDRFVVEWGIHRRDMKSGWTVDIPGFCFRIDGFPSFPIANNYLNGHDLDIITIIGNIYQNPELLTPPTI